MLTELFRNSHQFVKNNNFKYKRYFIKHENLEHRLSIILGARGIGKSVTIAQYMSKYTGTNKALYISLDDIFNLNLSIYEIAEEFELQGGKLLCLDEIHKYDRWSMELKKIYDNLPTLQVVASGSSALEIHKGSHDLSRRAIVYKMVGMSFREFLGLYHKFDFEKLFFNDMLKNHLNIADSIVDKLKLNEQKILPLFKDYLKFGYYPYFKSMPNEALYFKTLKQNINTTIESDLLNIFPSLNGKSIKKIKLLLSIISESVPFTPTLKKLKEAIDIQDDRTLKEYLYRLDDAGLIKLLMKSSLSFKNLDKPEKIYLENTNLMFTKEPNIGAIRETFFLNQLSNYYDIKDSFDTKGVYASKQGDFLVDDKYLFEIGGKNKSFKQVKDMPNSYVVADDIEVGFGNKIPLWLFGFLY